MFAPTALLFGEFMKKPYKVIDKDDDTLRMRGYIAIWGDENSKDLDGEYFHDKTDFESSANNLFWNAIKVLVQLIIMKEYLAELAPMVYFSERKGLFSRSRTNKKEIEQWFKSSGYHNLFDHYLWDEDFSKFFDRKELFVNACSDEVELLKDNLVEFSSKFGNTIL